MARFGRLEVASQIKIMSWGELERLVDDTEQDSVLRRSFAHCRSRTELVLAAQRLNYHIEESDIERARDLHYQASGNSNLFRSA